MVASVLPTGQTTADISVTIIDISTASCRAFWVFDASTGELRMTLRHDGPMNFTPDPLGPGIDHDAANLTPFTFVYRADGNPEAIATILESSNRLVLRPANLALSGERPDVDLNLAAQNIANHRPQ